MIKVDDGVKVPSMKVQTDLPLNELLPGQSFFVPDGFNGRAGKKLQQYVSGLTMTARRFSGKTKKFTTRMIAEQGQTGIRCWRTE